MKNKFTWMGLLAISVVAISLFIAGDFRLFANEVQPTLAELAQAGYVVTQGEESANVARLQDFQTNLNRGVDDEITILIDPNSRSAETLELRFQDGRLRLFYDQEENAAGISQFRIREYDGLITQYRGNRIEFVLVSPSRSDLLLSIPF